MKLKHVVLIGVVSSIMSYLNNNLEVYGDDSEKQEQLLEDIRNLVNDKLEKFDVDGCLEGLKNDVPEHIEKAREVASDITESLIQELNGIIASFTSIKNEVMEEQETEETEEATEEAVEETTEETVENTESAEEENVVEVPNDAFEDLIKTIEVGDEEKDGIEEEEIEEVVNDEDEVRNSLIAELEQLVKEIDLETTSVAPLKEEAEEVVEEEVQEEPQVEETTKEDDELDERENIIAELEQFLAYKLHDEDEIFEEVEPETVESETNDEVEETLELEKDDEIDDEPIIQDVEENEEVIEEPEVVEECSKEEDLQPITEEMLDNFDEDEYFNAIQEAINNSMLVDEEGSELNIDDIFADAIEDDDRREISKDEIDEIFAEILEQETPEEEAEETEEVEDETPVLEDDEETEAESSEEVEDEIDEPSEEEVVEETEEDDNQKYFDELLDQLRDALNTDTPEETEEVEEEVVEETPDIYSQINQLYPYLTRGFVRSVYELKETISNDYPINHKVYILHRLSFKELDKLRQFSEIVLNHGYQINIDERKMIVDALKECVNTDGKILTDIFEIANQASFLGGVYEGYRVEIID